MMETVIIIDSCSDLPIKYVEENNIPILSMTVSFKGKEYSDDLGKSLPYETFYKEVRAG